LYQPQSKDIFQAIANFVYDGGRLLIFNSASHVISGMFPGRIAPVVPSTVISGRVNFIGSEAETFSSWSSNAIVDLESYRYPIEVSDTREVKVLAEVKGRVAEPVVVQFDHGSGGVYVFVSRMFLHERDKFEIITKPKKKNNKEEMLEDANQKEEQKKANQFQQKRKRSVPPPQKKQKQASNIPEDFESYMNECGASNDTIIAWKCALNVGYIDGYSMAKRVLPCLIMMGKLLLKQQAILDDMFVKPNDKQSIEQSSEGMEQTK